MISPTSPAAVVLAPIKLSAWADLFVDKQVPPRRPGVYAWYFDAPPPSVPPAACVRHGAWTLLYVGIAPKAPPTNGKPPSTATLRSRLRQHFGGTAEGSTLRLTLGCLLASTLGLTLAAVGGSGRLTFLPEGERCLSDWMKLHARVCWVEHPRPWELEHELLGTIGLPLNLDGNHHHPFRAELSRVRSEARARARAFAAGA